MTKKIGMITIGQSPRLDVVPEMQEILGGELEVMEAGALDGLNLEEVRQFAPRKGDYILCTRMADGTEVVVARRLIIPRVQRCIDLLARKGAEVVVFLCTGRFPEFSCKRLFVEPQRIVDHFILALDGEHAKIGLLVPLSEQIEQAGKIQSRLKGSIIIKAASPYVPGDEVSRAAEGLKKRGPAVIVMHCMGYTQAMKERVREITGRPTVLARSLVARTLKELMS